MYKMATAAFAAGFVFTIGLGGTSTAQAGLLDFLFGWAKKPAPVISAPLDHPQITINKRVKKTAKRQKAVPALTPQEQLARTIDPVKNPNWHLEDPTLKKGDILVLADRVLVFKGGAIGSPKSYVALNSTRLLNAKERTRIARMTGHDGKAPAMTADAAPEKAIKLRKMRAADLRRRGEQRG